MTVEVRPALPEEMPEFARVVSLSLAMPAEQFAAMSAEWTLCAFDDGHLATAYAAWPFTMRMDGAAIPVAAVTTVSTHPQYRRRGNLRAIMETDFRRRHAQGEPVAALYASLAAIYQRYGYGIVTTHHRYAFEPRFLQFTLPQDVPGGLRESFPDDLATLVDVYRRFREHRTGYLHRGAPMWHAGVLAPATGGDRLTVMLYEEDAQPLGYCVYVTGQGAFGGPGPQLRLQIRDLCWLNPAAYRAIWEHLAQFDLVHQITWEAVPPDDPLPHLILEPRMLNDQARDGIQARLIDVDRAFAARHYTGEGGFTFAAVDPLCPWNEGVWEFQTSGSETTVVRTRAAPDFTAPISTLAMLLFGQISASEAARYGRLDVHADSCLARCDALLQTRFRPFCGDHF